MQKILNDILSQESLMDRFVTDVKAMKASVVLFGCGNALKYAFGFLHLHDMTPAVLLDNDPKMVGTVINGITISSFDDFKRMNGVYVVLIVPQDLQVIDLLTKQLLTHMSSDHIHAFDFINLPLPQNM